MSVPAPEWQPLIVGVAPTGARRTKTDHPGLPTTPAELAATAGSCREAGAALIHLHVRDGAGRHTLDADTYRQAIEAVRERVGDDLVVQVTSEAAGVYTAPDQMAMVRRLRPEAVSLALGEIVPKDDDVGAAGEFLDWLTAEGILPQYILYTPGDVRRFAALCEGGTIPARGRNVLFVLGRYAAREHSSPTDLLPFLAVRPDELELATWSVCAFGRHEGACALTAAALGGHARVGFENNLYLADGSIAPDNSALVRQVCAGAAFVGRAVASAADARRAFGAGE
ncbi:MAG: 3-keto-5-aminohexanoate cleavage protein [Alphaproteobacteria bacterium]